MGNLSGKVSIVAGASSGMGRATALALASAGCKVVAAARSEGALDELAAQANRLEGELVVKRTDTSRKEDVDALISGAVDRFGRVDLLVNTVGTNVPNRSLANLTDDDWRYMLDANLNSAYYLTRAILPPMKSSGGGLIIHVTSVSALWPDLSGVAYQAAKRGVTALAHATMMEERLNGIRVSVIFPGLCDTPLMKKRKTPPTRETLDKALQPEDVAAACIFLAGLPPRAYVPELVLMPGGLQCIGQAMA